MDSRFNVQEALAEMRKEQRDDIGGLRDGTATLTVKVDDGFKAMAAVAAAHALEDSQRFNAIDTRLVVVENTRRTMRWLAGSAVVAALGALADLIFVHAPNWFINIGAHR